MPTRAEVYQAIDTERAYQDAGAGNAKRHPNMLPMTQGEILLCIKKLMDDATAAWYSPGGREACLPHIRKIAGVCVQCMERFGAPAREVVNDPLDMVGVAANRTA